MLNAKQVIFNTYLTKMQLNIIKSTTYVKITVCKRFFYEVAYAPINLTKKSPLNQCYSTVLCKVFILKKKLAKNSESCIQKYGLRHKTGFGEQAVKRSASVW